MKTHQVDALIIGGGISGLSCGHQLAKNKVNFLLLTKNIGGRVSCSKDYKFDYGASYIIDNDFHMNKFTIKFEKLQLKDFYFSHNNQIHNFMSLNNLKYAPNIIPFLFHIHNVRSHLLMYRKKAPYKSIKQCFNEDPVLSHYWNLSAKDFIKNHGLNELEDFFGKYVITATSFTDIKNINALLFLVVFFPAVFPTHRVCFKHTFDKLTKKYKKRIKITTVKKVKRTKNNTYIVLTDNSIYKTKYLVFAAPEKSLRNVYKLPKPLSQQDAYSVHVKGNKKQPYYNKKAILFHPDNDINMMWNEYKYNDILFSKKPIKSLKKYYSSYEIVKKIHWSPALIIPGKKLIDQNFEPNAFLASDYNISLLEDSFLTGLYAANQIIKKLKK